MERALLPFVLLSFAANSLITRHVVADDLLDAGLLSAVRFAAGAVALVVLAAALRAPVRVGRADLLPTLWLGGYALAISYGYQRIGAAAGTLVFYAAVLLTLVAVDLRAEVPVARRRLIGGGVSLLGLAVLAAGSVDTVTPEGVLLLATTGVTWGLYTAAGRTGRDPREATTAAFVLLTIALAVPAGIGVVTGLRVTAGGLAWAVVMGAGTTALAYVAWYACQRSLTATTAGTVQLLIPVLTAVGAVLVLGEELGARLLVSAALVLAGLALGRPTEMPRVAGSLSGRSSERLRTDNPPEGPP